ncbi:MAG: glutamate 5-kinase [Spirochaetota bacterium]
MRNFTKSKRIVIKIGTNVLTKNNSLDIDYVQDIAGQVAALLKENRQILIVTSGAIGMGAHELELKEKVTKIKMRQACAAIGQPLLMHQYKIAFEKYKIPIAQILLTTEVLNNRHTYLNLRNSVETLLSLEVVPIFNENDSVSTAEIGTAFGDNDSLSALIASKVDADLLIMLTDIDAFYDKDPKVHQDAKPIHTVEGLTKEIVKSAGSRGSTFSTGGMKTKIEAVKIAENAGCRVVIANGREPRIINRILAGEIVGTIFLAKQKLTNRARWILNSLPEGNIVVDDGAMAAIKNNKSLLPTGVIAVEGIFKTGSVVSVNKTAKIVTGFNSTELESIIGKHSTEVIKILGKGKRDVIARPEDIVFPEE